MNVGVSFLSSFESRIETLKSNTGTENTSMLHLLCRGCLIDVYAFFFETALCDEPEIAELAMCVITSQTVETFAAPQLLAMPKNLLRTLLMRSQLPATEREISGAVRKDMQT